MDHPIKKTIPILHTIPYCQKSTEYNYEPDVFIKGFFVITILATLDIPFPVEM